MRLFLLSSALFCNFWHACARGIPREEHDMASAMKFRNLSSRSCRLRRDKVTFCRRYSLSRAFLTHAGGGPFDAAETRGGQSSLPLLPASPNFLVLCRTGSLKRNKTKKEKTVRCPQTARTIPLVVSVQSSPALSDGPGRFVCHRKSFEFFAPASLKGISVIIAPIIF